MEQYAVEALRVKHRELVAAVERYVEAGAPSKELHEVEWDLWRLILALGLSYLKEAIARRNKGVSEEPVVAGNGTVLPCHGLKAVRYVSVFGEVSIERAYYWKEGEEGVFPLDAELNLPRHTYSYLLSKWVQALVAEGPYDAAVGGIAGILGLSISKLVQEQVALEAGGEFEDFMRAKPGFDPTTEGSVLGAEADGKGVRMIPGERPEVAPATPKARKPRREKGDRSGGLRRMATATADFTFDPEPRGPEEMLEILMKTTSPEAKARVREERRARRAAGVPEPRAARNVQVAASMAGKEAAFRDLCERVVKRDPEGRKPIVAFVDGDKAQEEQLSLAFREAGLLPRVEAMVLDIMHAMEYVWEAGTALRGERGTGRVAWVRDHALAILRGRVGYVIGGLRQMVTKGGLSQAQTKAVEKAASYFDNHRHMMCYGEYLARGYPISTGLIEGTCGSLIKDRADRSGARWSRAGIQAVLNERAARKNGDWDDFWEFHVASQRRRLYANTVNRN